MSTRLRHAAFAVVLATYIFPLCSCAPANVIEPGPWLVQPAVDRTNFHLMSIACLFAGEKCDIPAQLVSGHAPEYPKAELIEGRPGSVMLRFVINEDGRPSDFVVESTSGDAFTQEALVAVKTWIFRPAQLKGKPVPWTVRLPISFDL